jgi:hypothetical protein
MVTTEIINKTKIYCEDAILVTQMLPNFLNIFRTPGMILSYNPDIKDVAVFLRKIEGNEVFILIFGDEVKPASFISQITGMVAARRKTFKDLKLAIAGNETLVDLYGRLSAVNYAFRGVYDVGAVEVVLSYKPTNS